MKYKIVRMYRDDRPSKIMYTGFTLEQAQAHCQNPNTSGDGWFDGYEEETEITITGLESALEDALDSLAEQDIASFYKKNVNKLKRSSK
tara:strand:- start:964 stop:1230 length:267 start_codon:yes stop_codon:yes gene_type:complete